MLKPEKICIVRLGGLGDVIHTLPALDALRATYPEAHLAWLVETAWAEVLPGPPRLDEVITLPKREWLDRLRGLSGWPSLPGEVRHFVTGLRRHRFDLAIDFHGNLRSGIATRLSGAPDRVGFSPDCCKEFNDLFTNRHFAVGGGRIHRIDRALALAEAAGAKRATDTPRVEVPDDALSFAREVFEKHALNTRPVVAVHPATSAFGAYKRWPVERYNAIIRRLEARDIGALVTWGPGEYEMAVAAAAGTQAQVSPPTQSIMQLAGLLSLCDAFVGADTGPGILAAAVDTPTVSLFGPKDPALYAPRHARSRVVEIPMACRPCKKRTCDDPKCVLHITVEHVAEAVFALLEEMAGN